MFATGHNNIISQGMKSIRFLFTFNNMDMSDSLASRVITVVIVGDGSVANKWLQWLQINGF